MTEICTFSNFYSRRQIGLLITVVVHLFETFSTDFKSQGRGSSFSKKSKIHCTLLSIFLCLPVENKKNVPRFYLHTCPEKSCLILQGWQSYFNSAKLPRNHSWWLRKTEEARKGVKYRQHRNIIICTKTEISLLAYLYSIFQTFLLNCGKHFQLQVYIYAKTVKSSSMCSIII